ncbi:Acetate CoA-transferase subunit alpha [Edwardsiella tarda]|nr:Acetate CoA-transferase subunit alpha [Edwardsiella tarda]
MKTKLITLQSAATLFRDGMTIMVGGFMGVGSPPRLISALLESGVRDLTLIANDTAFVDTGIGPLIVNGRVSRVIASHIGTNPETGRRMIAGEMAVQLVPQGTLIEQIRCGGAGLGGFLTPHRRRHRRRRGQTNPRARRKNLAAGAPVARRSGADPRPSCRPPG